MKIFVLIFTLCTALISNALEIPIGGDTVRAKPIAVVPFANNNDSNNVDFIIAADLKQSGFFAPVPPNLYVDRPVPGDKVDYSKFRALGVPYVVIGELKDINGVRVLRFALLDSYQEKVLGSYTVTPAEGTSLRILAHKASDLILQKLNGIRGAFATKLTYVYESGRGDSRTYQIMICDSDGAASKVVVTSKLPLMTPRFSPDMSKIAYVSFEGSKSHIVVIDIKSGHKTTVSSEPGINSSPAWAPDGRRIAMVLSKDGNPEVYIKDLATKMLTRVTNNRAIDTGPVWANTDDLYFTSDRDGTPQLYKINTTTGQLVKLTHLGNYNAGADVTKDGKKVVFAHSGTIAVVNTSDASLAELSKGVIDDTPRFSPNGQMVIFTSLKDNRQVLKIINVDGSGENVLSSAGQIRDPDWSGYVL